MANESDGISSLISGVRFPAEVQLAVGRVATATGDINDYLAVTGALRRAASPRQVVQFLEATLCGRPSLARDLRLQLAFAQALSAAGDCTRAHELLERLEREYSRNCNPWRVHAEVLVRERKYLEALERLVGCPKDPSKLMNNDTLYRAVKLRIYLAAQGMSVAFQQPAASPSVERVIIVMMVRDEEDIIAQNLKHHYLLGVRKFLLILNACRDKTEEIVRAFQASHGDAIVILIFDPVEGYFQAAKTQAAIEFASTYFSGIRESVDWCFILDADEFISLEEGLEHLIYTAEHAGRDVIVFNLCNATSSVGDNYDTDADPYTHFDTVVACSVPVVTKNAFLMKGEPTITMGNHVLHYEDELSLSRVLVAAEHRARLVHVPQRSVNQLRAKIVNGGRALAGTHFASDVGGHWRRMYQEYLQRGDLMLAEAFARYRKTTLQDSANQAAFHF